MQQCLVDVKKKLNGIHLKKSDLKAQAKYKGGLEKIMATITKTKLKNSLPSVEETITIHDREHPEKPLEAHHKLKKEIPCK